MSSVFGTGIETLNELVFQDTVPQTVRLYTLLSLATSL